MAAKPPVRKPTPEPPEHLSESSRELWRAVVKQSIPAGRAAIIQTALEARDRSLEASAMLRTEGLCSTTATTGAVHDHPAVKIEHDNRALFARLWSNLGLASEIDKRYW
jgi:P27 family predicted phage terminase small subunit